MPNKLVECAECLETVSGEDAIEIQDRHTKEIIFICDWCFTSEKDWPEEDYLLLQYV